MRDVLRRTRVRLTLTYSAAAAVVLSAGALAFWLTFAGASLGAIDSSLRGQAQVIASGLRAIGSTVLFNGGSVLPGASPEGEPIGALILDPGGQVIDAAGSAPPVGSVLALVRAIPAAGTVPVIESREVNGEQLRLLIHRVAVPGGQVDTLVLTRPLDEYQQTMNLVALLLGITVGVLVAGSAVSSYALAGRVLQPVRRITAAARDLSENNLDRRLNLDLPPDELGNLAATFDAMLGRLHAAFAAQRHFTADAAHELRGPLTALRSEVEVTLRRTRDATGYREALSTVLGETERLSRVVDQLLLLARSDAGALRPALEELDAFDYLEEVAERWRALAARSGVTIAVDLPADERIFVDPDLMRRALDNLLGNAIRYSPPGGAITMTTSFDPLSWRLSVADDGPGVEAAVRSRLFQRFARPDPSRSRDTGGAGLGLAIAAAIVQAHGGTLSLQDSERGALFVMELPRPSPGDPGRWSEVMAPGASTQRSAAADSTASPE